MSVILTITDRKYYKAYEGSGKLTRWQTDVVGKDIADLLRRHGISCESDSDEDWTLISWSTPRMQFWISVECHDAEVPSFQLEIGAGKRFLLIFAKSFPTSIFATEPWFLELRELATGPKPQSKMDGRQRFSGAATLLL